MKFSKFNVLKMTIIMFILLFVSWKAAAYLPYNTYTLDSRDEYVKSQHAYIPQKIITRPGGERLNTPSDIFIDLDDNIYIADTWGRRIIVLDSDHQLKYTLGEGTLMLPEAVYVKDDEIYVADSGLEEVLKFNQQGEILFNYERPDSESFSDRDSYRPRDIVVDRWNNLYIISEGNPSGLIRFDQAGNFLGYIASNEAEFEMRLRFMQFFYSREQLHETFLSLVSTPTAVALDREKLGIFTLTRGAEEKSIKRFNVSGRQLELEEIKYDPGFTDIEIGPDDNIFALSQKGYIFKYDTDGELMFRFSGSDRANERMGLFSDPSSIAVNSEQHIYVIDKSRNDITVFEPTEFTELIHTAVSFFEDGYYDDSYRNWKQVLHMNNFFNLAQKELGNSYFWRGEVKQALSIFKQARDKEGYSKAFKEIRGEWIRNYFSLIFTGLVLFILLLFIFIIINRRKNIYEKIKAYLGQNKLISELIYISEFIKHPISSFYGIKEDKTSNLSATIHCILFFAVYMGSLYYTNFIFQSPDLLLFNPLEEFLKVFAVIMAWIIANYLVSAINEGEGHFSEVFQGTVYAMAPYILIKPFIILISRGMVLEEAAIYNFFNVLIYCWLGVLLFFMVLGIHNYNFPVTLKNIFMTFFTMVILALVVFILYVLFDQFFDFIISVYNEVIIRVNL